MAIEIPNKILAFASSDKNGFGRSAGCTFAALGGGQYEITLERDVFSVGSPEVSNVLWLATRTDGPGWAHFTPSTARVGILTVETLSSTSVVDTAITGTALQSISPATSGFVESVGINPGALSTTPVLNSVSLSAGTGTVIPVVTGVDFVGQTVTTANAINSVTQGVLSDTTIEVVSDVSFPTLNTSLGQAVTSIATQSTDVLTGIGFGSAASVPQSTSASWAIVFFQFPGT